MSNLETAYSKWSLLPLISLGLPVSILGLVEATKYTTAPNGYPVTNWSYLLLAGIALFVFKLQQLFFTKRSFDRRARQLGCGPLPVYPAKDPILGLDTLLSALRAINSHRLLYWFDDRSKICGKTYYGQALGDWLIMTSDPDNIKAILSTNFDDWPIAGPRLYSTLPALGQDSIFTTNGHKWHNARALIRPSFVRNQVADLQCFDRHITNLLNVIPADGETFDMQALLQDMTMDSSTDFLLGYSTNSLVKPSPDARQMLHDFEFVSRESSKNARLGALIYFLPHPVLYAAVKRTRKFIGHYMNKAIQESEKGVTRERSYVFLDELLKTSPSPDFTIDQMLSILVAGRDTTATAMTAAFYFLARNPTAVEKLRKEIENVGEKNPTWEQLRNMKYMNNVTREALRLFPPVASNCRKANRETMLPRGGGPDGSLPVLVPKGTPIRYVTAQMHRDTDIYGPDADEFRPERWESDLRTGWTYIPFSGGPRICLGQQFALTQISLTLYRFFQTFKSIEARDSGPLLAQTNLTISFPYGCKVSVKGA
ncbi:cytochrome P450 [Cladorrhinum sp. PSN259]|nr:cytochrome P450 [Cladorrhinum sp. PSN259]